MSLCFARINVFVKRARAAKIHAYTIGHFKKKMPILRKAKAQERLIDKLEDEFAKVLSHICNVTLVVPKLIQ